MIRNKSFLINKVLRLNGTNAYFFDNTGTYRCILAKRALAWKIYGVYEKTPGGKIGYNKWYEEEKDALRVEPHVFRKAVQKLKAGDKVEMLFSYVDEVENEEEAEKRSQSTSQDNTGDFITKISKPIFKRESGNDNEKTFDFIYVDVCVVHDWKTDKLKYINQNLLKIKDRVVEHLGNYPSFKKFGVPVNFLRITDVTFTKDDQIHFVFELKKI